ncbi:neurogenic locus notch homolog protein 2-like isoform X2 [Stylophora pistillata]|uniref:neurogenic locus notch homolog protein 2-like isoform X2 n=1 Tax=Stylophora pistillata TaxID=50429 RepID=UPI000C03D74C|nr:neurogenic locus notch homolog protein 2-like isoform X2 [Stylophora pistillata]
MPSTMAAFDILLALYFLAITSSYDVHNSFNSRNQTHHPLGERFPWHVFVSSVKCSGVLVQERWILSSALCTRLVKEKLNLKRNDDSDHSTVFIRVGNHHVDLQASGEDTAPVLRALVYPKYNASASTGNVGLLYLARKVMLPDDHPVSHAKLPDFETNKVSNRLLGKITGWGYLSGRSSQYKTLLQSDVLLTAGRDCQRSFRDRSMGKLLDESWCAVAGKKGICSTDQGSPVVVKQDGHWFVVGVYTYGQTCSSATRDVALFSRIDPDVLQWIQKLFTAGDRPQCHPSGHKILDIPTRAQSNQVDSVLPLCDNKLQEAWYKLELDGIPAEIPTSCPEIGSCGTHAQIWLPPAGHPEFGEERNGSACVAWKGVDRFCCLWRLPVHVIHCGGFVVYRLQSTDDCSAYCAKSAGKVPCGPGKIGYAPKCRVREQYPILDGPPQITPVIPPDKILASESIHLLCTYDILAPGPYKVGYKVTWYKLMSFLGGKPGKLVLLTNRTEETAVVMSTKSAEFYLGDRIICEVMAFFLESPERTSPTFSSDNFFVGIKVEPPFIVTSEDHKIREFTLRLTVPLICQPDHPNCTIRISMHLVPVDNLQMSSTSDIALSTCEVILKPQPCSRRDCGRKVVRFVAVSDYIDDGDRRTRIVTEPTRSQSLLWNSYDPADVFVLSKDVKTPRCYLFTESYMKTLTGRYYRISTGATTLLLYKSAARLFEVHTRLWACSRSSNRGFCACGVAVRDGDDVIEINMCRGRFAETSVQISVRSRPPLAKGVRITEALAGKRYTVYFPSGVYVRVDVFNWGLNVQIQSSGRDLNQVTGLCSLGEVSSSSQTPNEGLPLEMNETQQWRILDAHSLFNHKPVHYRQHRTEKPFCLCTLNSNIEKKRKCASCELKCRRHQHVIWPALFRERDITRRVHALQIGRDLERRSNRSDGYPPLLYHPTNQSNLSEEGRPDTFLAVLAIVSYCKRLLTDTPLGKACIHLVGQRTVDQLKRICIRDTRFTGVLGMAWGVASILQDTCEDTFLKNTSLWEKSISTEGLTPTRIKNVMCPRLCSERGRCINGACKCRRGYTSDDCSVPSRSPPQLIGVHNDGTCDMKAFHCKQVRLVGEGFHNSRELKCSFAEVKDTTFETQTFLSKATYESFRGLTCETPGSHDTEKAFISYQVRVSNDGSLWSQPIPLFIFDGGCLTCTTRRMGCEIKSETCHIDGRCYRKSESSPQDPCKWCSPTNSQQAWTDIPCQHGSCNASYCVHGVCLDTTMGRYFCFCNEGFTGVNCDIAEDPCIFNPCGGGVCVRLGRTFRCQCPPGYTDIQCSVPVNPCSSNPCNNGSCVTNGSHFRCFCEEGFTGLFCETGVQSCPCKHGKCVTRRGNSVCMCEEGFAGILCEVELFGECGLASCKNGTCVEVDGLTKCVCTSGYTGSLCDIKIGSCPDAPSLQGDYNSSLCLNNSCLGENYNLTSLCEVGFTGTVVRRTIYMTQGIRTRGNTNLNVTISFYHKYFHGSSMYNVNVSFNSSDEVASDKRISNLDEITYVCEGNHTGFGRIISCENKNCMINESLLLCVLESINRSRDCRPSVFEKDCLWLGSICECYSQAEEDENNSYNACKGGTFSCSIFNKTTGLPCDDVTNIALSKGFVTECSEGQNCSQAVDLCYLNPCVNGNCTSSIDGIHCLCKTGFTGDKCDKRDFCQPDPCFKGKCHNTASGFQCECSKGYTGLTCTHLKTRCKINLCKHGDCYIETNGKLSCGCYHGYQGPRCENVVDHCKRDTCKNGLCINTRIGFQCLCRRGFSGKRCHINDPCVPSLCVNGNCSTKSDGYHCVCHQGYRGRHCNETADHCLSNPCARGQCVDAQGTYLCKCPPGFTGDTCNATVDVCQPNPCLNGNCINVKVSFKCDCYYGFVGTFCDKQIVFDPCERNPCYNGKCVGVQTLKRSVPSFNCSCHEGFTGQYCESVIGPCNTNPCRYGLCKATNESGFLCACFDGYQGVLCDTKINHCLTGPCVNGSCISTNASFECLCHRGYAGKLCDQAMDMCRPNPCKHGSCHQKGTSFRCSCFEGYTGGVCQNKITNCSLNPCKHGSCVDRGQTFQCYCKRRYSGKFCHLKVNPCEPNPCKHGSCLHRYSSWFLCRCELGYTGKKCDKKINMCQSQPCKHGECVNMGMSFRCNCYPGYRGRLCDKIETCQSRPCERGNCFPSGNSFTCACPENYTGRYCENMIDPCQLSPCKHGRCSLLNQSIKCTCSKGYTGDHCQVTVNPCFDHNCKHGRCIAHGVQFSCQCLLGFRGKYCETDIDECLEAPCFAGVQCTNYPGNYSCGSCPAGFIGDGLRCEEIAHPCKKLNCFRDVPCVQRGQSYQCGNCPRGFTGNGVLCTEIDACSSNPCHHLTQCIKEKSSPEGFRCGPCPKGYKGNGFTCTSLCPVPCPYGMECNGNDCRCPTGYQGVGCQTPFCRAGCFNGGTCIMPNLCVCAKGFEGPACLSPVCRPPCRYGGNCIGPGKCRCPHGFTGPRCEKKSCLVTCLNGGRCRGPYICQCMLGYSGQRCEIGKIVFSLNKKLRISCLLMLR